jgi:hypothetical protein
MEVGVAVFGFGTLGVMFDLGWRLHPVVIEKDPFGIPGWFTAMVSCIGP